MHFKKLVVLFILSLIIIACKGNKVEVVVPHIIPVPNSSEVLNGSFTLNSNIHLISEEDLNEVAEFSAAFLKQGFKNNTDDYKQKSFLEFKIDSNLHEEEYVLRITEEKILITSSSQKGAFYGFQTLRQMLPVNFENGTYTENKVALPCINIKDKPKFSYRGMHLDVGRHMYSVDFIKKYIDALAILKMNTFHWHLTEDQGWRIEIKKYPKLQEIAAYRDETLVGHYSDQPHQFDGEKYGGYYAQEEVKGIVAYAEKRFITIIPEIEMPGHSQAAIAAYPELGCAGEQVEVAKKWGVFEEIYCTKDSTFDFLEDVLDEVLELFPSKYIHIGGDEAPKTRWKTCANCQKRIKDEGLKDEHELQNYFITRMEKYLNSKGRQIIGWDEILEGGLAPNATVMSWRGTNGAVEAAKSGHNVVMTPTSHCYFDYYQSDNENEPLAIGGFLPLEKVYEFNPIPEELTNEEEKYVLGAQGNLWTEYMPTEDQVEYMAFPRMLAMSEVLWSHPKQKNYADFISRLENFHKRLDALNINYANHLYEIEGEMISESGKSYYELKTLTEGKTIRYTLDGSEPDLNSKVYKSQIPFVESTTIKAAVFNDEVQLGKTFIQYINYHKAVGAKITIDKTPHKAYSGSGSEGLINGISGSDTRYGDKEWLGFWGEDILIEIDLGEEKEIHSIETRFYNGNGQWIYAPKEIDVQFVVNDGSIVKDKVYLKKRDVLKVEMNYIFNPPKNMNIKVKSIKLIVPNYGIIREGKQGAGNNAWTFIDEIIIN
jgi:hexosaminidase